MKKIGDYLVDEKLCGQPQVREALERQALLRKEGVFKPLGAILVDSIGVKSKDLERCLRMLYVDILSETAIFRGLSRDNLEKTILIAEQQVLPENRIVFEKGDRADTFCVVTSGKVKVYMNSPDGNENILAILKPGDGFGEMALLTGDRRSASVQTLEATSLLVLSKYYFEQLCDLYPDISRAFIKILADRISSGNEEILNSAETERAYQRLVSTQGEVAFHPIVGQSKAIGRIIAEVALASSHTDPVLLRSEAGTMKTSLAKAIHKDSPYGKGPFLTVDTKSVALDAAPDSSDASSRDDIHLEFAQGSGLFGHEQDALPFVKTKRLGALQVCHNGTVLIKNVEKLTPGIQEQLCQFLDTGSFRPIGGHNHIPSGARIIASTSANLETLVKDGEFSRKLFDRIGEHVISIPTLRRRKGDLRQIVQSMIEHFNKSTGKSIKGIEHVAYQHIMAYDWPGNMEELEVVIRRAVNLAQGDTLIAEDIFIGTAPAQGKHVFNLLNVEAVKKVFSHRAFPLAPQIASSAFFAALFLMAFLGSQSPDRNVALILVWAVWWPMLAVSWFFGARIWCSICPMGAANDFFSRFCSLKRKVPGFVRSKGLYVSALGLCVILWAEAASAMPSSPRATGVLLLAILLFAVLSGLLFERRLWCRYLCPLGGLSAVFAGCSVVEWRANNSICNSSCKSNSCYRGREGTGGCPLYQGPFSLRSNQHCMLCGQCVKICENGSPTFNLRAPGHELWAALKPEQLTSLFVPVILGTQLFRSLDHTAFIGRLSESTGQGAAVLAALMAVSVCSAFLFVRIAGSLVFGPAKDNGIRESDFFNYALTPLALGFELGYQFEPLFDRAGRFFAVLGRQVGVNLEFLDFSARLGSALPWQMLFVLLGTVASLVVLAKLLAGRGGRPSAGPPWKSGAPIALLGLLYLFIFLNG